MRARSPSHVCFDRLHLCFTVTTHSGIIVICILADRDQCVQLAPPRVQRCRRRFNSLPAYDVNPPRCTFNVMPLYYRHPGMDWRPDADLFNISLREFYWLSFISSSVHKMKTYLPTQKLWPNTPLNVFQKDTLYVTCVCVSMSLCSICLSVCVCACVCVFSSIQDLYRYKPGLILSLWWLQWQQHTIR